MTSRTEGTGRAPESLGAVRPGPGCGDPLGTLLRRLLETGAVAAVMTTVRTRQPGRFATALVTDPERLAEAVPFHPVMAVQGARALSELTREGPPGRRVAALLRPCELRAFVENVKQSQGGFDDLLVISCACPGVLPAARLRREDGRSVLEAYRTSVEAGTLPREIRATCAACAAPAPGIGADLTVVLAGGSPTAPPGTLLLHTAAALEAVSALEGCGVEPAGSGDGPVLPEEMARARRRRLEDLLLGKDGLPVGFAALRDVFSACIGCRACREVCPLCHCVVCDYETDRTRWSPEKVDRQARVRGALRVPSGTLQFHLGRLMHISASCVSCGQCSEACPADIPVAEIFTRAAGSVQRTLGYASGTDPDGKPPLADYRTAELEDVTWSRRPR